MMKFLALPALAVALSLASAPDANAWTRTGSVTTWRGTTTVTGSGSCAYGTCSRQVTRTGPYGGSVSRQGSASCAGGVCTGSSTTTGPRGQTIYRQGTVYR